MARTYGNFTDFIDFSRASSGTYLGSDGLLKTAADNVPRVEYDANGNGIGLLIEEQRTNLITYSEDFTDASWSKDATITITSNSTASPSGVIDAQEVDFNTGVYIFNQYTTTSESAFTFSVYLKAPSPTTIKMNIQQSGGGVTEQTVSITTEWQRFSVTRSSSAPTFIRATLKPDAGGEVFYAWGAQLEQGSFPTSYIPTSGATATRSADIADIATANFGYNPKAGTIVVEYQVSTQQSAFVAGYGKDSTNYVGLGYANYQSYVQPLVGGIGTSSTFDGQRHKQAVSFNSTGAWGTKVSDNSVVFKAATGGVPALSSSDTLYFGTSPFDTSVRACCYIRSIKYRPRRNSNTQLQEFTS